MFQQFSYTKVSVPGLTGLMERFYCIPTGRILLLAFKIRISKIKN